MSWRIVACSCLLIALPARAEPDPQPPLPAEAQVASMVSEVRQDPEELLREALVAYAADDLAKARALFEEVHRLRPSARTLRALGVLAYRESRFAEAVTLLEESLASRVKPLTEELARGASELLGQARVLAQAASISAPRQDLAPGTVPAVDPPRPPQVVRSAPVSVSPASASRVDLRRLRRTSYALYAVAGAAVVVAVVGTALGMTRLDDVEAHCRESADASCTPELARQLEGREKLRLLSGLSIGGTVLAALSGASAVTLSVWLRGRSDAPAAGPIGGLAIQWTAHF